MFKETVCMDTIGSVSFGDLLKTFRKRKKVSQQELSTRLGVHPNTISKWERGMNLPDTKGIVLEAAKWLNLTERDTRVLLEASLTALSPYWSIPYPRNPFFTGQKDILTTLHTRLCEAHTEARIRSYALQGLGGIGKTQIALEYVYQHALEYSAVFWLEAENAETISSGLLRIAEVLQLPERTDKDQQHVVKAVEHWLATHHQWLLIWDNVSDMKLLERFLLIARTGTILLTTRCSVLGTFAQGIDLPPMNQEDGIQFLLRRAKILPLEADHWQVQQFVLQEATQYAAAVDLITDMGGLPLALDQVGAYIEETGCSLSGYLQSYKQQQIRLLDRRGMLAHEHLHSVLATFQLALERVEQEQEAAMDVLCVCALLHAEAIPEELFLEGAPYLGPRLASLTANPLQFDHIMAFLRNLSLIQRRAETRTLSLHRLIQAVLREHLSRETQRLWRRRVLQALSQLFPSDEWSGVDYWQDGERLLLHALTSLIESVQETGEEASSLSLLNNVAIYLSKRSRHIEIGSLCQRETWQGRHLVSTEQTLNNLMRFYQKLANQHNKLPLTGRATYSRQLPSLGDAFCQTPMSRMLSAQLVLEQEEEHPTPFREASADLPWQEPCLESTPHSSQRGTASSTENDPLQDFLAACCELHPHAWCRSADLWQAYANWVEKHQACYPLTRNAFIKQLKVHGCYADRTMTARIWRGIALVRK